MIQQKQKYFLKAERILKYLITDDDETDTLITCKSSEIDLVTSDYDIYQVLASIKEYDNFNLNKLKKLFELVELVSYAKNMKKQKLPEKHRPKGGVDERNFKVQLETYSRKFFAVLQKIQTQFQGKHAIFSFFKTRGGLYLMGTFLDMCGISYRLYTGDESDEQKTQILTEYNSPENKDGALIKVLLFSFAGSEGMTLTAVQHLHILETDLREGRARQVIGRTVRYKSHAILPENNRKVHVWRYWSFTSFNDVAP